jgi:hypothetical protein
MERAEEADLFKRHVLTATNLEQDITLLYYTGTPLLHSSYRTKNGVGDPDPHFFGPPVFGTGSINQRYVFGSRIGVERTEVMLAK